MASAPVTRRRLRRVGLRSVLALLSWVIPVSYFGVSVATARDPVGVLLHGSDATENVLLSAAIPVFFLVLLLRLLLVAWQERERAVGLLAMAAGLLLYGSGAASVALEGSVATVRYPAPGEVWMLTGYLGFAAYLYLWSGSQGETLLRSRAALGSVITFGGALCLSGILLALPVAADFGRQGLSLLVAVLTPTLDLALTLLVASQVLSGSRPGSWATGRLAAAFASLGVADTAMTHYMAQGTYSQGLITDALLALGFWLMVSGAVADQARNRPVRHRMGANFVTVTAAAAAVILLLVRPQRSAGILLLFFAVTTLLAVGGRLLLALHEATGAAEAYRLSLTDDLTALPNRRALLKRLTERMAEGAPTALLLLDLDGFKEINDTLGHAAGDAVLHVIATRLSRTPSGALLVSRLGGDEFALVFDTVDAEIAVRIAHTIRALIRKAVDVDGIELSVDCSIGVSLSGTGPGTRLQDHKELLRRADVAMYQAKAGREGAEVYDPARDEFSRYRLQLAQELARGIASGQLVIWYQPQVDACSGELVSLEALVRWQHPERGLVPPGDFLPVARRAGLMPLLTETVFREALDDAAAWHRAGLDVGVSINVAPAELLSAPVMSALITRVKEIGLPPAQVVIEVTEDSFLSQPERTFDVIMGLRGNGLQVSIDDYGTGFSSLNYLKSLPVHELKMDQSFVRDILVDPRAQVIVASTIKLARGLNLRLVAEGVEDAQVARVLADMGVDLLQGYHFAKPMPVDQIFDWVAGRASKLQVLAPRQGSES
ncbi:MAG TPA: bifunctional diguanylate cyclase/phosphodiesterase [Kineosporiaceae bacterium]|nr:bifunctional diguanylate cyclase/phosphodiesterase [Kineosporiaceae bacterium]